MGVFAYLLIKNDMIWVILILALLISSTVITSMWLFSNYEKSKNVDKDIIEFDLSEMPTISPTPTPLIEKKKRGRKPKKS